MSIEKEYLKIVRERFENIKSLGEKAIAQLSEEDIHWSMNEDSNSTAVIVKHLTGNMLSRWTDFLHSDGEKPDRNRDQEFVDTIQSKNELMAVSDKGWSALFKALDQLTEEDLLKKVYIRGEKQLVIDAIERQLVHYASHVGQILYIGKQLKGADWKSLSIPKGKSEEFRKQMLDKHL